MHNNVGQTQIFISIICLLYSTTCCPNVFELNEQFAKGNVSQLAVTKIDLYETFGRFKPKSGKIS